MKNKKHYERPELIATWHSLVDVLVGSSMSEPDPFGQTNPWSMS